MMTKVIIFDWGRTVAEIDDEWVAKVLKEYGIKRSDARKSTGIYRLYSLGKIKSDKEYLQLYNFWVKPKKKVDKKFLEKLNILQFKVRPSTKLLLKKLKGKYKLVLATNFVESWLKRALKMFKLTKTFDLIVVSSSLGVRKPDTRFYYYICKRLKVKPSDCMFVSDELNEDLSGAKAIGMVTVWLKKRKEPMTFKPDFEIRSLPEILKILNASHA